MKRESELQQESSAQAAGNMLQLGDRQPKLEQSNQGRQSEADSEPTTAHDVEIIVVVV